MDSRQCSAIERSWMDCNVLVCTNVLVYDSFGMKLDTLMQISIEECSYIFFLNHGFCN